jgi:hypothetical protein
VPEPDDGTLSPWTVITPLPFAPEIALPSIQHYWTHDPHSYGSYGMMSGRIDDRELSERFCMGVDEAPISYFPWLKASGLFGRVITEN